MELLLCYLGKHPNISNCRGEPLTLQLQLLSGLSVPVARATFVVILHSDCSGIGVEC